MTSSYSIRRRREHRLRAKDVNVSIQAVTWEATLLTPQGALPLQIGPPSRLRNLNRPGVRVQTGSRHR